MDSPFTLTDREKYLIKCYPHNLLAKEMSRRKTLLREITEIDIWLGKFDNSIIKFIWPNIYWWLIGRRLYERKRGLWSYK